MKQLISPAKFTLIIFFLSLTKVCGEPPSTQKEPPTESKAQENHGGVVLHIRRVLMDDKAASAGVYYDWQVKEANERNKSVLYYEVSITNTSPDTKYINQTDFTLEDADGVTYKESQTLDWINATVQPDKSARGGIAFLVPRGCIPRTLVYSTAFRDKATGEKTLCRYTLSEVGEKKAPGDTRESSSTPSPQPSRVTSSETNLNEKNPLNFTVTDIKKYSNFTGPQQMTDPGWSLYKLELANGMFCFWVKNETVYFVDLTGKGEGGHNVSRQEVENVLSRFSNGHSWTYLGVGLLPFIFEWTRDDGQAGCDVTVNDQDGTFDLTITTNEYKRIMEETMKKLDGKR